MWWLSSIFFLALQLISVCSGIPRDKLLSIQESYNSIYSSLQQANLSYIGNGNVSAMDIMGLEIDEKVVEKYKEMDIEKEVKNINEMADILDKWDEKKTDFKKDIEKGFDELDSLQELNFPSQISNASEEISKRITEIHKKLESEKVDDWTELISTLPNLIEEIKEIEECISLLEGKYPDPSIDILEMLKRRAQNVEYHMQSAYLKYEEQLDKLKSSMDIMVSNGFKEYSVLTQNISQEMEVFKELKDLSTKLIKVEDEIQVLEELRDSQAPINIKSLLEGLENAKLIVKDKNQQENIYLEKEKGIEETEKKLRLYERKLEYYKSEWVPFKNYLTKFDSIKSKLSQGNLKSNFEKLRGCLNKINTLLDFSEIDKKLQKVYDLFEDKLRKAERLEHPFMKVRMFLLEFFPNKVDMTEIQKGSNRMKKALVEVENLLEAKKGRAGAPDREISEIESALLMLTSEYNSTFEKLRELENETGEKLKKSVQFINCYKDLTEENSNLKSEIIDLLDTTPKAFDYNVRPLTSTIDAVLIFKSTSKSVDSLKQFKFGSPNNFPSNSEEIKDISDGLENIKIIIDIQKTWRLISHLDIQKFNDELSKFIEELSIDTIPTIDIDPILDFINSEYQGGQKRNILKLLENIKKLQVDYSEKMERMNDGLSRMKEWMGEQPENSIDYCDCSDGMEIPLDSCQRSCRAMPAVP